MANIPITDNTTLLNALKTKAQNLPNRGTGSGGGSGSTDLSFVTATASDILEGKKGADSSGNPVNGSMTNRGAWTSTKTSNGSVTIPEGYHNGSGKVTVNVSTSSTDAPDLSGITAAAEDILAGKKSVDATGAEITGTMTNQGAWSTTKTSNGSVTIPEGYHNGSGKVTVNVSTSTATGELDTPSISFDKTLGRFTATSKVKTSGYISTSDTTTKSYTLNRYLGGEYTPTKESKTITLKNKYCTGNVVIKGDDNLVPANIKNGTSIFGVQGTYGGGSSDFRVLVKEDVILTDPMQSFYVNNVFNTISSIDDILSISVFRFETEAGAYNTTVYYAYYSVPANINLCAYGTTNNLSGEQNAGIEYIKSGSNLLVRTSSYRFEGMYSFAIAYQA